MPDEATSNWYPFWSPRFWHGMRVGDYFQLLYRNRFAIHPARWPMALIISGLSPLNSVLSAAQEIVLGRRVEGTKISPPPIFILGHWRTGTTLLHELLTRDSQFAFPSNYDCFAPNHFLISKPVLGPLIGLLMPRRRPMDDMQVDLLSPQEDEFALCAMGAPTPYLRMAFPNRPSDDVELLNLDRAPQAKVAQFRESLTTFLKRLTYQYGERRLVLKSPPHTGRIAQLAEWFPGAKFIHLARNPFQVFTSTLRLWKSLDQIQGFQLARYSDRQLEDFVLSTLREMYTGYFADRDQIAAENLIELTFEDLVADPEREVEQIYQRLGLGELRPEVRESIADYRHQRRGHRLKSASADEATQERVRTEWVEYFESFGYTAAGLRNVRVQAR